MEHGKEWASGTLLITAAAHAGIDPRDLVDDPSEFDGNPLARAVTHSSQPVYRWGTLAAGEVAPDSDGQVVGYTYEAGDLFALVVEDWTGEHLGIWRGDTFIFRPIVDPPGDGDLVLIRERATDRHLVGTWECAGEGTPLVWVLSSQQLPIAIPDPTDVEWLGVCVRVIMERVHSSRFRMLRTLPPKEAKK